MRRPFASLSRQASRSPLVPLLIAAVLVPLGDPATGASIPPGRYAIGDSVMLGAKEELQARDFVVNAVVSRQFRDAVAIVRQKAEAGLLRKKVVIHLGTNGILIDPADCDKIVKLAGPNRLVYLVTITVPKWYRDVQNTRLRKCADRHATAYLIDWYGHSRGHPSWFADDGYHLRPIGQRKYAAFLDAKTA